MLVSTHVKLVYGLTDPRPMFMRRFLRVRNPRKTLRTITTVAPGQMTSLILPYINTQMSSFSNKSPKIFSR